MVVRGRGVPCGVLTRPIRVARCLKHATRQEPPAGPRFEMRGGRVNDVIGVAPTGVQL